MSNVIDSSDMFKTIRRNRVEAIVRENESIEVMDANGKIHDVSLRRIAAVESGGNLSLLPDDHIRAIIAEWNMFSDILEYKSDLIKALTEELKR